MRSSLIVLTLVVAGGIAAGPLAAQEPSPGTLQPQSTSPQPGTGGQTGAPPAPAPPQNIVAPPLPGRVFAAEEGLIFNAIRPDRVADFDVVIGKLRQALASSKDPIRNQQGRSWRIFKATEPGPNGSVLYVFLMDPVVKGADYGVAKILAEAYPMEITELYRMYSGAFATAGQTLLNLQPVTGQEGPSTASSPPASTSPVATPPAADSPAPK
jgi:hypothetical protein